MQQMQGTTDGGVEACAAEVLEVAPLIVRTIRSHMRAARAADLSIPQFRALAFLKSHPGVSLSDVAEHVGLTLPAASRMIDGLVARNYAERRPSTSNRRCVELRVSTDGYQMVELTRRHTQLALEAILAPLSAAERAQISSALETLKLAFTAFPAPDLSPIEMPVGAPHTQANSADPA